MTELQARLLEQGVDLGVDQPAGVSEPRLTQRLVVEKAAGRRCSSQPAPPPVAA